MRLWKSSKEDIYKLSPLTENDIREAEYLFNKKLPKEYIDILHEQNGGEIQFNAHYSPVPTSWGETHIALSHIMGIGKENGILETPYLLKEWEMPQNLILLSGDGHTWIALDYRKTNDNPPVIYIDNELNQIVEVASSFNEFLNGLYIEEEEIDDVSPEWVERDWTLEEIKTALSSNDEQNIIVAFNYLVTNPNEHVQLIEENLITLLQNSNLEIKQLVANLANHFNEEGLLSSKCIEDIILILRKDKEIEYYADMFFAQ